ncbi:MAG: FecR family protein, partial [Bacteroidota bacterium]
MDKKEFFTLVDKHEKGQCSKAEEQALLQFYDRLQSRKVMASWDLSEKEEAKIRLLKRILHTVRHQKREKVTPFHWKALAKIAAVFIGVLGIGYVVLQNTLFGPEEIPDNVITLELEDGSIEVIEDDGNATVEQSGQIIGKQQGGQMVYAQNANIEKLVYNTLKVPYGKKFNIQLSDGSVVQLNSGSSITYPVNFIAGEDRKIALQGEAFFEVQKDSIHPFLVNTGLLEIEVLGTRFNVIAYTEDEETNVVLTEGSVSLRADNAQS